MYSEKYVRITCQMPKYAACNMTKENWMEIFSGEMLDSLECLARIRVARLFYRL